MSTQDLTIPTSVSLKEKYRDHFKIGAAVNPYSVKKYGELIAKHFNSLTCENEMKPSEIHPEPNRYRFDNADVVAEFARANSIPMRGHTFVWHNQTPNWFFDKNVSPSVADTLADHIKTVSERYSDIIYAWDVVNEAVNDFPEGGALREHTPYLGAWGKDYIYNAFRLARSLIPENVSLAYNDYNESVPFKRERIIETVKSVNRDGMLCNVIGMQSHWHIGDPDLDTIKETIEAYASTGCKIQITELDVSMHKWGEQEGTVWETPESIEAHAKYYGDIFRIFREYSDVIESVTLWGVTDGTSWLNGFPVKNRRDSALLFTDDGEPKEAFYRITDF